MKALFPGYYTPTEHEFKTLWDSCLFVFDTNVLLDIYRLSKDSAEELLSVLTTLKDDILIPYHVAKEYHLNVYDVIKKQSSKYDDAITTLRKLKNEISAKRAHPFLEIDELNKFEIFCSNLEGQLLKQKEKIYALLYSNPQKDQLAELLSGKIRQQPNDEIIKEWETIAKDRYEKKIPPGYKDNKKTDNKYGDYFVWAEIMQIAEEQDRDVIFITSDNKEDWFFVIDGKVISARPELIIEFQSKTKHKIHIYQLDVFLKHIKDHKGLTITDTMVNEVEEQQSLKKESKTESHDIQNIEDNYSTSSADIEKCDAVDFQKINNS